MGQSQSPSKSSARPTSTMFQNNLALKIKDSAFKKHLSTHAFLRTTNLRDIDSKYSKQSNADKCSSVPGNLNQSKQNFIKKKESSFSHNHNFTDTPQGFRLSDIQQNEAEYEDEETKRIFKTNPNGTQKATEKSRKASEQKLSLSQAKKQSIQQLLNTQQKPNYEGQSQIDQNKILQNKKDTNKEEKQTNKLKINEEKQHKLSDYDHSNMILFTESKKVSSCKSFEPSISKKSQKGSEIINVDSKVNSNLQLQSHKSPSKHRESESETQRNENNSVKPGKIRSENEDFRPCIETRIKSRKAPEVCGPSIQEEKLEKTIINSRKAACKDQNSITVRMQNPYKTTHHEGNINKGKSLEQHLFRSCKKVYASQIDIDSGISTPQSPSYQQEKDVGRDGVNKLMSSKMFQEDLSIKRLSVHERKSHRQKIRDSISLGRVRKKLVQSMHNLNFQSIHDKSPTDNSVKGQDQKLGLDLRNNGSRLSLSSRFRSKIRQKLSQSKAHSQKSSVSSQQKLVYSPVSNSSSRLKQSRMSVREMIKKMNENDIADNLQNTQDNYFNENIDDKTLSPKIHELKINNQTDKLKRSLIKQTARPSEYEIKPTNQQHKNHKDKSSNLDQTKNNKSQSKIKLENSKSAKRLYVFTDDITDKFQDAAFTKTKNITFAVQQSNHRANEQRQIMQTIREVKPQDQKHKSPRRTEKNPEEAKSPTFKANYLKEDIQKTHISVHYSNKKNWQPQDKKPLNIVKFSQIQPNPFDVIQTDKLTKTVRTKLYTLPENSKFHNGSKLKDPTAKNIEIIDKLINIPINSKSKNKRQTNRNEDVEAFIQELDKLRKIKEIEQKIILENVESMKKSGSSHSKASLVDFNKEVISEQISLRVQKMNKLKELKKLTRKIDPALLAKSKSSEILRVEYQNISRTTKLKDKKGEKKPQDSLQKDLYYSFSKQMGNLSYLKDSNLQNSKAMRSLKDLNAASQQYMIDVSRLQKTKHLKTSKADSYQLACIPESPEIKYHPQRQQEFSMQKKNRKETDKHKKEQTFTHHNSKSLENKTISRQRQHHEAASLQKSSYKKSLIVF